MNDMPLSQHVHDFDEDYRCRTCQMRTDADMARVPPSLDLERLARAIKALIRDFTWESENVRLELTVGPVPYGPAPWTIGGNPDGNVALAIAHAYEQDRPTDARSAVLDPDRPCLRPHKKGEPCSD